MNDGGNKISNIMQLEKNYCNQRCVFFFNWLDKIIKCGTGNFNLFPSVSLFMNLRRNTAPKRLVSGSESSFQPSWSSTYNVFFKWGYRCENAEKGIKELKQYAGGFKTEDRNGLWACMKKKEELRFWAKAWSQIKVHLQSFSDKAILLRVWAGGIMTWVEVLTSSHCSYYNLRQNSYHP